MVISLWPTKSNLLENAQSSLESVLDEKKSTLQAYYDEFLEALPQETPLNESELVEFFTKAKETLEHYQESIINRGKEFDSQLASENHYFTDTMHNAIMRTARQLCSFHAIDEEIFTAGLESMWVKARENVQGGEPAKNEFKQILDKLYTSEPKMLAKINVSPKGSEAFRNLAVSILAFGDENVSTTSLGTTKFPHGTNPYSVLYGLLKDCNWDFNLIKSYAKAFARADSNMNSDADRLLKYNGVSKTIDSKLSGGDESGHCGDSDLVTTFNVNEYAPYAFKENDLAVLNPLMDLKPHRLKTISQRCGQTKSNVKKRVNAMVDAGLVNLTELNNYYATGLGVLNYLRAQEAQHIAGTWAGLVDCGITELPTDTASGHIAGVRIKNGQCISTLKEYGLLVKKNDDTLKFSDRARELFYKSAE